MSSFRTWLASQGCKNNNYDDDDDDDDDEYRPVRGHFNMYSYMQNKLEQAIAEENSTKRLLAERNKIIETPIKPPEAPDDNRLCVVCMDRNKTHVFISCGHACVCEACSNIDTCPLCRTKGKCIKLFI